MTATTYAQITRDVNELVARHDNACEPGQAAVMVARAAFLHIAATQGRQRAAERVYQLADELATTGME